MEGICVCVKEAAPWQADLLTQIQALKNMLIAQFGFMMPDGKIIDVPPGMDPTPYGARNADFVSADQTPRPARSGCR